MTSIKPKNKKCVICGRDNQPWFSKKRCKTCAGKTYAKPNQKTPINRKDLVRKASEPTGEGELFREIWNERPHICFVTGKPILEPTASVFSHVLAKGLNKYPKFKLYKKNIQLLLPEIHSLFDHGTEEQRERSGYPEGWKRLYALREELLTEYKALYGR